MMAFRHELMAFKASVEFDCVCCIASLKWKDSLIGKCAPKQG